MCGKCSIAVAIVIIAATAFFANKKKLFDYSSIVPPEGPFPSTSGTAETKARAGVNKTAGFTYHTQFSAT